jgi:hypothetical protein
MSRLDFAAGFGYLYYYAGMPQAFLLTPIPEPSAVIAWLLVPVVVMRRRR